MEITEDGGPQHFSRLQEDLIFIKILTRLPVKTLIRFQLVCKKWRSLISSPEFAKWHVDCATSNPFAPLRYCFFVKSPHSLMMLDCAKCDDDDVVGVDAGDSDVEGWIELDDDLRSEIGFKFLKLIGSCNGLLCFATYRAIIGTGDYMCKRSRLYIYNPSTHQHFAVSNPLEGVGNISACGFGYLSSSDDYAIVVVGESKGAFYMFSLNSIEWTMLKWCNSEGISGRGVMVDGKLHWFVVRVLPEQQQPSVQIQCILAVDLGAESYEEVAPPIPKLNECSTLCVVGRRLCVWTADMMVGEMWMLKDYGLWDSWTQLFSLNLMLPELPSSPCQNCFGFTETGKAIVQCGDKLLLVDRDRNRNPPKHHNKHASLVVEGVLDDSAMSYVESLVSPFPAAPSPKRGNELKQARALPGLIGAE
ncbi:hypothetical protein Dimus_028174 [Dionaea muscipula]